MFLKGVSTVPIYNCMLILDKRKTSQQMLRGFVAPPVGLEPTTLRLTAACSTD